MEPLQQTASQASHPQALSPLQTSTPPPSLAEATIAASLREPGAEARKKHVDKLIDGHLAKLAADLDAGKSETLLAYLRTMGRFHRYSFGNQILIAIQAPQATHVAGFHAWKKFDRFVKKGEKGIVILAPVTRTVGTVEERQADGSSKKVPLRRIVNAKPVFVFDVSQTEGEPLPEFAKVSGDVKGHQAKLEALYAQEGVKLEYVPSIAGGALGVSCGKLVQILDSLEPAQSFQTAVHELAHELLHRDPQRRAMTNRKIRETEAEAVAYVVCSAVGLDCTTASSDYLQLYGGDRETLEGSLAAVRLVSRHILDHLQGDVRGELSE